MCAWNLGFFTLFNILLVIVNTIYIYIYRVVIVLTLVTTCLPRMCDFESNKYLPTSNLCALHSNGYTAHKKTTNFIHLTLSVFGCWSAFAFAKFIHAVKAWCANVSPSPHFVYSTHESTIPDSSPRDRQTPRDPKTSSSRRVVETIYTSLPTQSTTLQKKHIANPLLDWPQIYGCWKTSKPSNTRSIKAPSAPQKSRTHTKTLENYINSRGAQMYQQK